MTAAQATQAVGALLLLGLLTAPAGAAHLLSASPYRALALSGALAVAAMWSGLTISYEIPELPPSSCVIAVAAAFYLLAFALAGGESSSPRTIGTRKPAIRLDSWRRRRPTAG